MAVFRASGSPQVTGDISQLLLRDLNTVKGASQLMPNDYNHLFETKQATMNPMTDMEMNDLTWGNETDQAVASPVGTAGQGISTSYPILSYTNSFYMSLPAYQDNLYKDQWTPQSEGFVNSQNVLRCMVLWGFVNNANNSQSTLGDGEPLFSTQHALSEGTFSNTYPTPVALSKDSLTYSTNSIALYTSFSLYPKRLRSKSLEIGIPLSQLAQELLFSTMDPTTSNNATNALMHGGYYSEGINATPYIIDPSLFMAVSDDELGFKHWEYMEFTVEALQTTSNWVLGFASIERFGYGAGTGRCCHGSSQYSS